DWNLPVEIGLQLLGDVDDDQEDRKAESRNEKDLPKFAEDVAIQRANESHQSVAPPFAREPPPIRANHRRTPSIFSDMPPPRDVARSVPMRRMSGMATIRKMILSAHIAQNGVMKLRFASDSPLVSAM